MTGNDEAAFLPAASLVAELEASPYHQLFGFRLIHSDAEVGEVVIDLPYSPNVARSAGSDQFHGGAIASLADIAGDYALWAKLGFGVPTIDLRVDYLRPASGSYLRSTARVRRSGRTVGIVDVEVADPEGRIVALGRGCYGTRAS